jgi:hypothetical protein
MLKANKQDAALCGFAVKIGFDEDNKLPSSIISSNIFL